MSRKIDRRQLYFKAKSPHLNATTGRHRKANDYRSLRVYRTDLDADVPELAQRFCFYLRLSGLFEYYMSGGRKKLNPRRRGFHHYLERIARDHLKLTISNYTIDGFIRSEDYGPRSNPTPNTKKEIKILTKFLEKISKQIGSWEEFKFKYHQEELNRTHEQQSK